MAENPLEREHVAAGHKVVDGESMTEQVDVEPGDIRALLGAANHERHGLDSEPLPLNREGKVRRLDGRPEVVPVPSQGSYGSKTNRDSPLARCCGE